jgi:hypothetical protein
MLDLVHRGLKKWAFTYGFDDPPSWLRMWQFNSHFSRRPKFRYSYICVIH